MRSRNESSAYYEELLDLTRTIPFIQRWNAAEADKISVFHLVVAATGRILFERPAFNRFVAGGRIYQRRGVYVSFAVKPHFTESADIVTVKLEMRRGEPLRDTVRRIHEVVDERRSDKEGSADRELRVLFMLPKAILSALIRLARLADAWNLIPGRMIKNDPMYTSAFIANLGSLGIDRVTHQLYEYGTCSVFCVIGVTKKVLVPDHTDLPAARDVVSLRFTQDTRINDGYYGIRAIELLRRYVEDPTLLEQPPSEDAVSTNQPDVY